MTDATTEGTTTPPASKRVAKAGFSSAFADFVRSATRPVLTFMGLLAWVAFIESGIEYPPIFEYAVLGMLGSWFGERFITRIQGK